MKEKAKDWARKLRFVRERWPRPLGTRPPIGLAVCAVFRDEARYLPEWVSFHRIQGVERFYLYDNRSSDDWRSALAPEIDAGIVEVQRWPFVPAQLGAYQHCLEQHRDDARWIAFIDVDEFLFSPTGKPLPEVLRRFDLHPGVVANWRMYGTSGYRHPPEGLVTENYVMRGPDDLVPNQFVKSIVNPRSALAPQTGHFFLMRGDPVGEDGKPVREPVRDSTAEVLRINHYYSRSEEEFKRKAARPAVAWGRPDSDRFSIPDDAVRDETILQFAPDLRALLASRQ